MGFGALSAFQGTVMVFPGETIGENLTMLVQASMPVADCNLILPFALQEGAVPAEAEIVTYST
jgi:hypothetical protein